VSFHTLSTVDRIKKYRRLAAQASAKAAKAKEEDARKSFLMLAAGWEQLADTVERDFRNRD
jgi:hypothetical protein